MLNRSIPLVVCLSAVAGIALAQGNQGTGYVVQFGTGQADGQFQGFVYDVASIGSPTVTNSVMGTATQIVAKPDGSKFYVIGSNGVTEFDPSFTTGLAVNGITGVPTQAVMSPDGRRLLVAASLSGGGYRVYVLDTATDTVGYVTSNIPGTIPGGTGAAYGPQEHAFGIVVSRDSTVAYVLAVPQIYLINLTSLSALGGTPVTLQNPVTGDTYGGGATSFSMSPYGLLYITAHNSVLELDPSALQQCLSNQISCNPVKNSIGVNGTPGPPQFMPDGSAAYFVNLDAPNSGPSLFRMGLAQHDITTWSTLSGNATEPFDSIVVASNSRLFAHSPGDTMLWDVTPDFSTVVPSALSAVVPTANVTSMLLSNEQPGAHYLFLNINAGGSISTMYRVDLVSNTVTSQTGLSLGNGPLQFVYVPQGAALNCTPTPNTACYTFVTYNTPQTLAAGDTAAPLIAFVYDPAGRPVYGVPVTFTGDPSLTFANASTSTNADGFVQATVTLGQSSGDFPVTLTAGTGNSATSATFDLNIPGSGPGGGTGGGNGPTQISAVFGDGGLYLAGFPHFSGQGLTVLVTDPNGNPLPNVAVTFTVTGPQIGVATNPNATTDANGLASTDFFPLSLPQFTSFEATTVNASASVGSLDFTETVFQRNTDGTGTGGVGMTLMAPTNNALTIGEGETLPDAVQVYVYSESFAVSQNIPGVGIRLADPADPTMPGAAACVGDPLSDQTGTVTCNAIASCTAGVGIHGLTAVVGEFNQLDLGVLTITPGISRTFGSVGGDGQSGIGGATLPQQLTAVITDKCGTPIANLPVTWKVTQGTATLSGASAASNANGSISAKVILGGTPGPVKITVSVDANTSLTFTATIQATVASVTAISGMNQTALTTQAFLNPLVFQVSDASGTGIPNQTVNFSVSGPVTLGALTATTDSKGQVSVTATAQGVAGTATISAKSGTVTGIATLTVLLPGPNVSATSFVNAASLISGLVPCGLATVTGPGLAATVSGVVLGSPLGIGPLPYTLSGVTISVNGNPAPLLSVSNQSSVQQVNFQTPCETATGSATVSVAVNGATTQVAGVPVYAAQPGIFTYAAPNNLNYGWIISAADGSYLTSNNPAHVGQQYYLVATGLGQTTPAAKTDTFGTGSQVIPTDSIVLGLGSTGVTVNSVQYVQGAIGEYVITFTIPQLTNGQPFPTGTNLPITLGVNTGGQTIFDTAPVAIPGIQ